MQDPSFRSQALLGVLSSASGCWGDQRSLLKNVFIQNKRTRISIFFFSIYLCTFIFHRNTAFLFICIVFYGTREKHICSKKIN
jgi:hypothetical protein